MKKLLAIFLITATLLTCAACGSRKPSAPEQPVSIMGTLEKQSYTNEILGMGCLLPSSWTYLTADKIDKIAVGDGETCVMYATASAREVIRIDFCPKGDRKWDALDLTQFCRDYLSTQNPFMDSPSDPAQDAYSTPTIRVGDQDLIGLMRTVTYKDITAYFASFAVECDGYIARITVSTFAADRIPQIMAQFYRL